MIRNFQRFSLQIKNYSTVKHLIFIFGLMTIIFILIILLPKPHYKDGFTTITELENYTKTLDDKIKMEGKNILNPSYENFYKKKFHTNLLLSLTEKLLWLLHTINLFKPPAYSPSFFSELLTSNLKYRSKRNWKGNFIQKICVNKESKIIVFGAVQGALHSLVRYLKELKSLDLIDENFKLKKQNYYMVFLGNVVNRSPYTLEIFSIILTLLRANPENVVYLRGTQETTEEWKNNTLMRELELSFDKSNEPSIPLEHEISDFFETLPLTIYVLLQTKKISKVVRLSPNIPDESIRSIIKEENYIPFLLQKDDELSILNFDQILAEKKVNQSIELGAIITDIKKRDHYEQMDGLRLLNPVNGITSWTVLSTASEIYNIGLGFFYEAFVIINFDKESDDWAMTLYNRDTRNLTNLKFATRSYHLFTGDPF